MMQATQVVHSACCAHLPTPSAYQLTMRPGHFNTYPLFLRSSVSRWKTAISGEKSWCFSAKHGTHGFILQDIVLAQDAIFMWGNCSISWRYVGSVINSIRRKQQLQSLLQTRNLHNAFFVWHSSTVHRIPDHFESCNSSRPSTHYRALPFLYLLDLDRSFEVTDPRDEIYGLLGFPTNDNSLSASSIVPDYALSASKVYTEVTIDSLRKSKISTFQLSSSTLH
ncbi:hypothetical protein BU25DRAFT_117899 [Macroventuria anomochaeta]|uniref:Uncharacterized protein n=1 Tax=Macroventuria anomochaeta TaxID=301207 RepID=A0ACB6RTP0_9PLEO|nr:uncharacterized protein BU25DRAFT_117899 [Macroventuria anomochaeta]KAF2625276.1 hypothetical protein BU25DRAFT_117899 [Macroventuria anomochaeta]